MVTIPSVSAAILPTSDEILAHTAASFIAYWEGFIDHAEWDVNAYRLGFGSDTEGLQQVRVTKGMTTTRALALGNLALRVPAFMAVAKGQLGSLFDALGLATKVAAVDLCYNYGRIPDSILHMFLTDGVHVARAIRLHESDNAGINRDRRNAEAGLVIFDGGQEQ